jgi:hypothetical protein
VSCSSDIVYRAHVTRFRHVSHGSICVRKRRFPRFQRIWNHAIWWRIDRVMGLASFGGSRTDWIILWDPWRVTIPVLCFWDHHHHSFPSILESPPSIHSPSCSPPPPPLPVTQHNPNPTITSWVISPPLSLGIHSDISLPLLYACLLACFCKSYRHLTLTL